MQGHPDLSGLYGLDNGHFSTNQYTRDIQNPLKLVYNIEPLVQPFRQRKSFRNDMSCPAAQWEGE